MDVRDTHKKLLISITSAAVIATMYRAVNTIIDNYINDKLQKEIESSSQNTAEYDMLSMATDEERDLIALEPRRQSRLSRLGIEQKIMKERMAAGIPPDAPYGLEDIGKRHVGSGLFEPKKPY